MMISTSPIAINFTILVQLTFEADRLTILLLPSDQSEIAAFKEAGKHLFSLCEFACQAGIRQVQIRTENLVPPPFEPSAVLENDREYQRLLAKLRKSNG